MLESTTNVYIAFGTNLGDLRQNIRNMLKLLERCSEEGLRCSSLWCTEPTDMDSAATDFINGVVQFETRLEALDLLQALQQIEQELGRPSEHGNNESRVIDLDIISFGLLQMKSENLTVPHKRVAERRFVLAPLAELAPHLVLPGFHENVSVLEKVAPLMRLSRLDTGLSIEQAGDPD